MKRREFMRLAGSAAVWPLTAKAQDAANYPSRPVTVVVPYAAGGGLDLIARVLAQKLTERTGQSFFVENRLGAGGVIAANDVAKATADGYTIFAGSSTQLAIQVTLHKTLPYSPATDFMPIALVATVPFVLIVNPSLPVQTAGDLIKLAKQQPGKLSFGSSGVGGPPHLYMELLQTMTGTQMTHIPYKGTSQAIVDVVAGRVPILMSDVAPAAPLIKAGTVRALGVSSTARVAALPDVPPIAEKVCPVSTRPRGSCSSRPPRCRGPWRTNCTPISKRSSLRRKLKKNWLSLASSRSTRRPYRRCRLL